jgi:protein CMS1
MEQGLNIPCRCCLSSTNLSQGALATDRLERIVIDASYIDQKKRGILEMKETQVPLVAWLGRGEFRQRYGNATGGIQLLFY